MRQQSYFKEFARYAFLSVLGTLGVSCYILADTFFISKGLGTKGLAALNLAIPVYNFIHGTGLMLGMGGGTRFTICKSQKEAKKADIIFTNTIYLAILFAAVFMVIGICFAESLAALLGADEQVLDMTTTYLRCLLSFAPAFILNDILLCFIRNDESPLLVSVAMLTGSFSNILLDYVFIFPLQMGMFGAILATGLSPIISIAIMSPHWLKREKGFHLRKVGLSLDVAGQNLSLGFPSLIAQISGGVAIIVFNILILGIAGNTGIAAYGVIANISLVVVGIYTGIAQGVQPLISYAYGSGNQKNIRLALRYAMMTMVVVSAVIDLFIFLFPEQITAVFNSEQNAQLQEIAVVSLRLYFTSAVFVGFNTNMDVYFTSTEKILPAHVLSLLRGLVLLVPMAFLLSALWGMTGIWITYPFTELIIAVLGCLLYRHFARNYNKER